MAPIPRSVVYVCHPFRRDPAVNRRLVADECRKLALSGYLPLAAQIYLPQFLDEDSERSFALSLCLRLLSMADEVRVYHQVSEGMRLEIAEAERLGIPVAYIRQPDP